MKFKALIGIVFFIFGINTFAINRQLLPTDSIHMAKQSVIDTDSILNIIATNNEALQSKPKTNLPTPVSSAIDKATERKKIVEDLQKRISQATTHYEIPTNVGPVKIDSLILFGNPLFIDLVFMGYPTNFSLDVKPDYQHLFYGQKPLKLTESYIIPPKNQTPEQIISDLRYEAREMISRSAADVYILTYDDLPDPNGTKSYIIEGKSLRNIRINDNQLQNIPHRRLFVRKILVGPWQHSVKSLLQFSQNMASSNWYQGGSSTMSVLGVLMGQLNYDNKKNIQWENYGEWRMGINAVFNDPTAKRAINTNDDVFKINSKLGVKAGENLFYSGSVDFSTQLFHNYKAVNSDVMKSTFLTPVRLNVGMGLDYKYKKLLSVMLSPVSFKYIYILETDANKINPNLFGIKTGENHLSEIGSTLKAQLSYSPFQELQVDSKFSFYTNYEKVEIDWEIVGNFTINRFLSTRLSLNPRYDNTVIGEKALLQFKELLSFGFSYKLLN